MITGLHILISLKLLVIILYLFIHFFRGEPSMILKFPEPGRVAQSVTCLASDAYLTADPGVASLIPARSHTFMEIDHEIIFTVILLPSAD